jgi:hypothetical protein
MPAEHTTRAIAAVHAVLCTGAVNDDGRRNHSPRKTSCAQGLRRRMHTTRSDRSRASTVALRRHGAWMPACPWTAKSSQVSLPEPWGPPLFFSSGHRSLHVGPARKPPLHAFVLPFCARKNLTGARPSKHRTFHALHDGICPLSVGKQPTSLAAAARGGTHRGLGASGQEREATTTSRNNNGRDFFRTSASVRDPREQ